MSITKKQTFLTIDPGKEFCAWCAIRGRKILDFGMFVPTISNITELQVNSQVVGFKRSLRNLLQAFPKVKEIVIERFQPRPGMGGGANAEYINIMIGVVLSECARLHLRSTPVQASTWKNHMSLRYDPVIPNNPKGKKKAREKREKRTHAERLGYKVSKTAKTCPIKDHEFDAIGIAQWVVEKRGNVKLLSIFKKQIDKVWRSREDHAKKLKASVAEAKAKHKEEVKAIKAKARAEAKAIKNKEPKAVKPRKRAK